MASDFQANDRARFEIKFTEDPAGAALSQQMTGRVPFLGVVRLPALVWRLPRDQAFAALQKGVKALPSSLESEAEAVLAFAMELARLQANVGAVVTFGDRKPDGKLDITVELSAQMPGGDPIQIDPFTVTPPIAEAVDAAGVALVTLAGAIPLPGAAAATSVAVAVFKAALRALRIA